MTDAAPPRASEQDGSYPRPQLVRERWLDLGGPWAFEFDDDDQGMGEHWYRQVPRLGRTITVPFPPEAESSGIGDTGFHPVLWYARTVTADELTGLGHGASRRLLLHFGAVDYRADVWIDGAHHATHEGGHTPYTVELPAQTEDFEIVVRAFDDPHDLSQPRGKQDWELEPHDIWYRRTSGIWQTVWLESVPAAASVRRLTWEPDPVSARVGLTVEVAGPATDVSVRVRVRAGNELLAESTVPVAAQTELVLPIPALHNIQGGRHLLWSPSQPTLIDATIELVDAGGRAIDTVSSYFGIRSVEPRDGRFLLNGNPHVIRGVLSQGFWPQSHLTAPSPDALRAEVQLIKELGFTTARIHQKIEDPRFLYWADRLGLMVWAELPSAYVFTERTVTRLIAEWLEVIARDRSHPSVVAWVPMNESWGVDRIVDDERQQQLVRSLYHLTKAIDPTRPVISNDGWEHTESDLLTVHDYENDPVRLAASYASPRAALESLTGVGPSGRRTFAGDERFGAPIVLSEFGGVSIAAEPGSANWGYRVVDSAEDFERQLHALFDAVRDSAGLAGWCFTQLTDTLQETNGLVDEHRTPKLPIERLRAIVTGRG